MKYGIEDFIEINKNQILADISVTTSNADIFTELAKDQSIEDFIDDMETWIDKVKEATTNENGLHNKEAYEDQQREQDQAYRQSRGI